MTSGVSSFTVAVDEHEQPAVQEPTRSLQEAAADVILGGPRPGKKRPRCDCGGMP